MHLGTQLTARVNILLELFQIYHEHIYVKFKADMDGRTYDLFQIYYEHTYVKFKIDVDGRTFVLFAMSIIFLLHCIHSTFLFYFIGLCKLK